MNYLTEESLGTILKEWAETVEGQYRVPNSRFIVDYKVTKNNKVYYVEFDGFMHFTCPDQIDRDKRKDALLGNKTIRIPYFVQLDE